MLIGLVFVVVVGEEPAFVTLGVEGGPLVPRILQIAFGVVVSDLRFKGRFHHH